jgi:glycosyltransferase involved in cell wall biosynthesis
VTVAVILAAYQARADWLQACLASIDASAATAPGVALHVRIGVDGCADTAAVLEEMGRSYYWTPDNVGAYIVRNSLIRLAPADAYVIFDADDVMLPAYLPSVMGALQTHAIVGPSRLDCAADLTDKRFFRYRHGVCAFRHEVLAKLGGYQAERLGADVDFIARARAARIHPHITGEPCYLRRRHPASLTKAEATGFGSAARHQARKRMERIRLNGKVYVQPVTVPLEMRGAAEEGVA